MAVLVQDLYNKLLAMIDNYTEDGVAVAPEDNIDVEKKFILFADQAQKELWKYNKVTKQIKITTNLPENRLGNLSEFDIVDFEGDIQYYPDEKGVDNVQGYSIQVTQGASDNATLTYQEQVAGVWTNLLVVMPTGITENTTYKGVLAVSDTSNPVRLKIEGTEHFRHVNRALWKYKYKSGLVPTYQPWVKYDLPDDFNAIDAVVEEFPIRQYNGIAAYKIENYRDFYYDIAFDGEIRIDYKPIPSTITALTDTIEIDDVLAQAIMYDAGSKIGFYENKDIINYCEQRRAEMILEAGSDTPNSPEIMTDFYQGGGY